MKALINRLEEKSRNQQELLKMIDNKLFEKLYEFCYVRTSDSSKVQGSYAYYLCAGIFHYHKRHLLKYQI
jgi:hypothetical protein